jgi:hypothetical protein
LPGIAWDIWIDPLLPALATLEQIPGVLRAGLASAHLRAITETEVGEQVLLVALESLGTNGIRIERVEPTLEDVFLALAS